MRHVEFSSYGTGFSWEEDQEMFEKRETLCTLWFSSTVSLSSCVRWRGPGWWTIWCSATGICFRCFSLSWISCGFLRMWLKDTGTSLYWPVACHRWTGLHKLQPWTWRAALGCFVGGGGLGGGQCRNQPWVSPVILGDFIEKADYRSWVSWTPTPCHVWEFAEWFTELNRAPSSCLL